jgi:hypothetical protein
MWKVKGSIRIKSRTGLQLWKIWIIMWASRAVAKVLEKKNISKFQPKKVVLLQNDVA